MPEPTEFSPGASDDLVKSERTDGSAGEGTVEPSRQVEAARKEEDELVPMSLVAKLTETVTKRGIDVMQLALHNQSEALRKHVEDARNCSSLVIEEGMKKVPTA